jgi:[protein-PII] uridylyltransferase
MEIAAKLHSKLEARTAQVDALVISRFPGIPGAALLACGGYGRREMFPFSDVDLLILTSSDDADLKGPLAPFIQDLWDAGLRVSQSVHTLSECLSVDANNIELTISLLDQRFLAGDAAVYQRLAGSLDGFFRRRQEELLRRLTRLTRERHQRYQNTIFHLEPNLKDGPGGLRDFQMLRWFARLNADLDTASELNESAEHLFRLRVLLHELSGRDNNTLDFESQDQIASDEDMTPGALMSGYFRHARKIQRAAVRLLDAEEAQDSALFARFRERWNRLSNGDFSVSRGLVYFRAPQHDLPRLFEFVARHGIRLAPDTGRRVHAEAVGAAPFAWKQLQAILALPHAALALREMHDANLLTAQFPELVGIESLVIRDFYHQYTVDEHTLVAIGNIVALRDQEGTPFAELAREHADLSLLLMALLFHDSGKGDEFEGHAEASAKLAEPALIRIGMPAEDRETVLFLIRAHLEMSATMNSRDLSDPQTIRAMADRVETVEKLKLLTLLTYADISAVNPSSMSPWRGSLLWQLYSATHRELMRELQSDRLHSGQVFLEGLPVRYQRTHAPEEIAGHIRMADSGQVVDIQKKGAVYELTAVAPDRPALFASIAGAISSFGMNIVKAEAFSNASGTVVDTFTFADPLRTLELNPSEVETVRKTVRRAALGEEDVAKLLKRRPAPRFSSYEPRIAFDNDASDTATLVQIIASDRPGLLYSVASALSEGGCNIEVVLVDTQGRKAIDVFYVTPKLTPDVFAVWTERLSTAI